jgi:GT2 family glycosyltransferase
MKPRIFVVILNWNGWMDTFECIKAIQNSTVKDFVVETIVVDNASTDESVEKISKTFANRIVLLKNKENLGYAGGNNIGIKYALEQGADYVCILNNDTVLHKNIFVDLLESFNRHLKAGIASPKMYFSPGYEFHKDRYKKDELGSVIWYAGGDLDWANVYGTNHGVDQVDTGQFEEDRVTDFASGACLFGKREVFEKVGLFNEKYFLYLEDTDLSQRVKRAGYEVWYLAKPKLWHKVSQGSAIGSQLNDYFIHRNRLVFGMQYASLRAKIALIRESLKFILSGRPWQRRGVVDFYLGKFGKGSWKN